MTIIAALAGSGTLDVGKDNPLAAAKASRAAMSPSCAYCAADDRCERRLRPRPMILYIDHGSACPSVSSDQRYCSPMISN
jgi:hypothetical protein